ncbi:hypothetical protein PFISCL1PPCAC_27704, partial [Pristionchus fissidentatus]
ISSNLYLFMRPLLLFLTFNYSYSFKFLVYSPQFAESHVNYLGKLADSLIDAGHEVVILSPVLHEINVGAGSKRARVIEVPQSEKKGYQSEVDVDMIDDLWSVTSWWEMQLRWERHHVELVVQCEATIHHPGLIEQMKTEQFDVAFAESIDWCFAGIIHLVGIENFAFAESIGIKDGLFPITQIPSFPSYVPTITGGRYGDDMTFLQRAFNFFNLFAFQDFNFKAVPLYQELFDRDFPGFPPVVELLSQSSLHFINSDPLIDFPHLSAARIVDVGGIAVSNGYTTLNKTWSTLLDLRPRNVLISFGTFAQAHGMPPAYKKTLLDTIKAFPDVTFMMKYEKPEHNFSGCCDNLIEGLWLPQNDLLRDPRLSAFLTHGGQGSVTEASYAGVPMVVVPVIYDQAHNAFEVKRNGLGIVVDKTELAERGPLETALRKVLDDPKYKIQARKISAMLSDKPFSAREIFVRNMEFLASHGPLRQLDHYGRHLNFIQYYSIDVISAAFSLFSLVGWLIFLVVRFAFVLLNTGFTSKQKQI